MLTNETSVPAHQQKIDQYREQIAAARRQRLQNRQEADEIRARLNPFVKHVRDRRGRPIGTMFVARVPAGPEPADPFRARTPAYYLVGWSQCNPTDPWDRHQALILAASRAVKVRYPWDYCQLDIFREIPRKVSDQMPAYLRRIENHCEFWARRQEQNGHV